MSVKTTFLFAIAALAVMGTAVALPMTVINAENPANGSGNGKSSKISAPAADQDNIETFDVATSDPVGAEPSTQKQPNQSEDTAVGSESPSTVTDVQASGVNTELPNGSADAELLTTPALPSSTSGPAKSGPVQGQRPRPYGSVGGVQTVNMGQGGIPFFLEFFQPFQPFPGHSNQQPFRHQQPQPFGASVDPFDPFVNPLRVPSFDQLVSAYTNEFRNMLLSLDKGMSQMHNIETTQNVPSKPVGKTTTKTEIIDGHVVQINETTYSDGDDNHKTFYHFKEIQVLPEKPNKKIISNEKIISTANNDSETQKEEMNEMKQEKPELSSETVVPTIPNEDSKHNLVKKVDD